MVIKIKDKFIYYNEEYDVTIIEIDEKKEKIYEFLELEENILDYNKIDEYLNTQNKITSNKVMPILGENLLFSNYTIINPN